MLSFRVAAPAVLFGCANSVDTCVDCGDATSLLQGLGGVRHRSNSALLTGETCAVGDDVACADTNAMCAGNQCCPDGSICPSADNSFSNCPLPKTVDCTAPEYELLHTQGCCNVDHAQHSQQHNADSLGLCVAACAQVPGCRYFAYSDHDHTANNCRLYQDCPAYGDSRPSTEIFDAYEMIQPGSEDREPSTPETVYERYEREIAEISEFACSQNRVTPGRCQYLGCWGWRGDTECVQGQCVCSQGCSNSEGICVSAIEFWQEGSSRDQDHVREQEAREQEAREQEARELEAREQEAWQQLVDAVGSTDTWVLSNAFLACETNDDFITVEVLGDSVEHSLQDCTQTCEQDLDCVAVDWFIETRKCNRFPRACTAPTASGGMSYVMAQEPMKAKACASWNEEMSFLGPGWLSTDVSPQEISDVIHQAFSQCSPDDVVTVRIEEKDVGYSIGSDLMTSIFNRVLMSYNEQYRLFHSGIRFTGCGKSVMFQLQLRTWGLSNAGPVGTTPFGVSQQYPVTSPDGHTMWTDLMCNVPGRGMRDLGSGNIIYYKVEEQHLYRPWVRGEYPVSHLAAHDIDEFVFGIARYFSWWNIRSRYYPETLLWAGADGASTKLREQVTCDTFTLWMTSQLIAFQIAKGYPATFPTSHWEGVNFNMMAVTISDTSSNDGPAPVRGELSEIVTRQDGAYADMEDSLLRSWSMTDKQATNGIWATVKGAGICLDVPESRRLTMLQRDWRNPQEQTTSLNSFSFMHGSNPLDYRFYCTDRVSMATSGYDLVAYGLWHFFYIRDGYFAGAMDWDVTVESAYDTYGVLYNDKAVAPGGTPAGPWHAHVDAKSCGVECPWEYPVPDPGEGGFHS